MKRTFIILIALAVGLALIAGAIALFQGRPSSNTNTAVNETPPAADTQTNTSVVAPPASNNQADALARARSFSERYGSWSLDTLDAYASGLTGWLTPQFEKTVTAPTPPQTNVTAIATQALSVKISRWTADQSATAVVTTSRTQTRTGEAAATYYENLTLDLLYSNSQWLINSAAWSPSVVQPGGSGG